MPAYETAVVRELGDAVARRIAVGTLDQGTDGKREPAKAAGVELENHLMIVAEIGKATTASTRQPSLLRLRRILGAAV